MKSINSVLRDLKKYKNPAKIKVYQWFFKTGPGQYGEGDTFLGLNSEQVKTVAKKYQAIPLPDIELLLNSKIHEARMSAVRIMVSQYSRGNDRQKLELYNFYLARADKINNWDLVDASAPNIVGDFLLKRPRKVLYQLAKSKNLWRRRIAILATLAFIRQKEFADTFKIARIFLKDRADLIHKAAGWMLREVGKRDKRILKQWLRKHYRLMPRTMLRYAIEKFSPGERAFFMQHHFYHTQQNP